jgi:hypothetical protein
MGKVRRPKPSLQLSATQQFQLFIQRAQELLDRRLVRTAPHNGFELKVDLVKGTETVIPPDVDEEDFRSFLVTFRMFISNEEPIYMDRILNLCQLHIQSEEHRLIAARIRNEWKHPLRSRGIETDFHGQQFTMENLLRSWINGPVFHNDIGIIKAIEDMDPIVRAISQGFFVMGTSVATDYIIWLANVLKNALDNNLVTEQRQQW